MDETAADPPNTDDRAGLLQLREALWAAGFTAKGVAEAMHAEGAGFTPRRTQLPALLRRLDQGTQLAAQVRLFLAAVPVAVDEAAAALAPLSVERAVAMGLVSVADGTVHARVRLAPAGDLLVACDLIHDLADDMAADTVVGVSASSRSVSSLTVRRPVEDALDLGTGSGIQALLAARHATRVTATDTNPRALAFARFNALLNGMSNVEFVEGDMLAAVAGRSFDLVVSNPPFVISPDADYLYRDGGRPRDALSRELVEGAAGLLRENGFAHVLVSWIHAADEDWSLPLREWVAGTGCDAWLLHYKSDDPVSYATDWNQPLQADVDRYTATVERWLDYFEAEAIEAIAYGAVTLRRRSGDNWTCAYSVGDGAVGAANDQVRELFAARDYLAAIDDPSGLLDRRFVVDHRNRLDQSLRWADNRFEVDAATLRLGRGLAFRAVVDVYAAHLLSQFDGNRTVREAMIESVPLLSADVERTAVESRTVTIVSQMVELGFILPAR